MKFRAEIREFTRESHARLEQHHLMRSYSSGALSKNEYGRVLNSMSMFWWKATPEICFLNSEFYSFFEKFRTALLTDCEQLHLNFKMPIKKLIYEEEAFFYTLIGSSHGARFMLPKYYDGMLPAQHLNILAEQGEKFWPKIISILNTVGSEREKSILSSGKRVFDDLFHELERAT